MEGNHGDSQVIYDAIRFALDYTEIITIGGGEPTLHPDFFKILKKCLWEFDAIWMATNGSQTDIMLRLVNILNDVDFPECNCYEELEPEEYEEYGCLCYEKMDCDIIMAEGKLSVALSQDYFHDPINYRIVDIWKRNNWEIRDVTKSFNGISEAGRAKENNLGGHDECVCPDIIIKPDGELKLCGCLDAPVIGDIYNGIGKEWENIFYDDDFNQTNCHRSIANKKQTA